MTDNWKRKCRESVSARRVAPRLQEALPRRRPGLLQYKIVPDLARLGVPSIRGRARRQTPEPGQLLAPLELACAGGADADERFTLGQVRADEVELRLGRRAAADAQEKQVGFFQRIEAREVVRIVFAHVHERAADAAVLELFFCKHR